MTKNGKIHIVEVMLLPDVGAFGISFWEESGSGSLHLLTEKREKNLGMRTKSEDNSAFQTRNLLILNFWRRINTENPILTPETRTIEDFESVNTYLQTFLTSGFTNKSFVPFKFKGVHCLVNSILTYRRLS
jgi:hypothetical protein